MGTERAAKKALRQKAREERKYEKMSPELRAFKEAGEKSNIERQKEFQTQAVNDYYKSHGVAEGAIISPPIPMSFVKPLEKPAAVQPERFGLPKVDMNLPNQVESTKEQSGLKAPVEYVDTTLTHVPNIMAPNQAVSTKASKSSGIIEKGEKPYQEKKTQSFSDMLAPLREQYKQEKTDAVKMQKYYALADAFKALGKMGGTAIGSAIGGGKAIDNASPVGEYKASRGYLDAFEKAKNANEKLRGLDEYEFKLNLSKQQRDEERAYNDAVKAEDRKYKAELMRLESELRQAEKAGDRAAEETFRLKLLELTQAHEEKLKKMSVDMVRMQMGGDVNGEQSDSIPFTFQNLTKTDIPKNLYPELINWAISLGQIGNDYVDNENAELVLRKHPELVNSFLNLYGLGTKPEVAAGAEDHEVVASKKKTPSNVTAFTPEQIMSAGNEMPTYRTQGEKEARKQERIRRAIEKSMTKNAAQIAASREKLNNIGGYNNTTGYAVDIDVDEDGVEWE